MIIAYLAFLLLGIVVFFLAAKLRMLIRIAIALAVCLIPSAILTVWVLRVGDKPAADAITIVPKPSTSNKSDSTDSGTSPRW